jgi:feruloyl esterase
MRQFQTALLAACGLVTALPAIAQVELAPLAVGATQCTVEKLGAKIEAKQIGEPVSAVVLEKFNWHAASERTPALCVVEGQMLPVDQSATARPIKFAVALPGTWNRRSIHQGGGGINGSVPQFAPNPQRAGPPGAPPSDVARGFAVYGSDSGHGQESQWTLNDEAIRNFGFAQLKKTHDVAQILITRMYGEAPRFRYFVGSSQGGREGLTVAQRYPRDYHGVAANVPVVALSGLMQAPAAIRRQEMSLAKRVPQAKGKAIAAEFMRQCDGLDGLDDGLINHYMACREIFNVKDSKGPAAPWAARRCPDGRDPDPANATEQACLTDGQIETLQFIFSNQTYLAKRAHDTKSFGMWVPTTEVIVGGLPPASGNALLSDIRYLGQEGAAADARVFTALGSVGVTGFLMKDLAANPLTLVEGKAHQARQRELSGWLDSTNPDLRAYQRGGGKLIVAIGTNDTLASPGAQLDYYAALVKRMGQRQLDQFARLYVLPQRGHGLQGNFYALNGKGQAVEAAQLPSQFDRLAMLQRWVEQGVAPAASETVTGARGNSGLMCSYPMYSRYVAGARDQAAAYRCQQ